MSVLTQIFYVYTCRANKLLVDFINEVYFKKLNSGYNNLNANDPKDFIKTALSDGRINSSWSASTISKVSEHIIATLIDFELIEKNKTMINFRIIDLTANFSESFTTRDDFFDAKAQIHFRFSENWSTSLQYKFKHRSETLNGRLKDQDQEFDIGVTFTQ